MKNLLYLPIMAVIACSAASAQQVTDFRRPGDTIRLEVKFDGPDASKISTVLLSLNAVGSVPASDQVGFQTSFNNPSWAGPTSPHTFDIEVVIPANAATGDYKLYVNARAEAGSTQYAAGEQFQLPLIHIRNNKNFVPPAISVTELH
jgi:hypothetical protein